MSQFHCILNQLPEEGGVLEKQGNVSEMPAWALGSSRCQPEHSAISQESWGCLRASYLQVAPGSIPVLLFVGVPRLCPVRVDGDGDQSSLFGPVRLVVQVPGFCMGLYQVVPHYVRGSPRPNRDSCRDSDSSGAGAAIPSFFPFCFLPGKHIQDTQSCPPLREINQLPAIKCNVQHLGP